MKQTVECPADPLAKPYPKTVGRLLQNVNVCRSVTGTVRREKKGEENRATNMPGRPPSSHGELCLQKRFHIFSQNRPNQAANHGEVSVAQKQYHRVKNSEREDKKIQNLNVDNINNNEKKNASRYHGPPRNKSVRFMLSNATIGFEEQGCCG